MSSRICETQAIVLRRYPFRETSLIVSLYTHHYGKISGIVKGIRREPRRYGSYLDIFSLNDIIFYQRPLQGLCLISQAVLLEHFAHLSSSLPRFGAAGYVTDLVDTSTVDRDVDAALFILFHDSLKQLERAQDPTWLVRYFEIKLLGQLGWMSELDRCNLCHRVFEDGPLVYHATEQMILCRRCARRGEGFYFRMETLSFLRQLTALRQDQLGQVTASLQIRNEATTLLRQMIDFHIGYRLRSLEFARKMEALREESVSGSVALAVSG
jgi:DNA repair protein RecO (recombination protein O)